jgi:uncharacterized protein YprB with RNaseH-like and TPR domain
MKEENFFNSFAELSNRQGFNKACKIKGLTHETGHRYLRYHRASVRLTEDSAKRARILFLDIETSPIEAYVWQKQVWNAKIDATKVVSDWFILSYAIKWYGDDEVKSSVLTPADAIKGDDRILAKELWHLLDEADIVITHNGDSFDIPNIKSRFIYYGFLPPTPYKSIDTLKIVRKEFGFTYNSLNFLVKKLGLGGKIETNFDLWIKCMGGDEEALKELKEYNEMDVKVLESLYLKIRPWGKSQPNMALYSGGMKDECPICGSTNLKELSGDYKTKFATHKVYRCGDCGAISRDRKVNTRVVSTLTTAN